MSRFPILMTIFVAAMPACALAQDHSAGPNDITYGTGNLSPAQGKILQQCEAAAGRAPGVPGSRNDDAACREQALNYHGPSNDQAGNPAQQKPDEGR